MRCNTETSRAMCSTWSVLVLRSFNGASVAEGSSFVADDDVDDAEDADNNDVDGGDAAKDSPGRHTVLPGNLHVLLLLFINPPMPAQKVLNNDCQ